MKKLSTPWPQFQRISSSMAAALIFSSGVKVVMVAGTTPPSRFLFSDIFKYHTFPGGLRRPLFDYSENSLRPSMA